MRRVTSGITAALVLLTLGLGAQTKPKFSGHWVVVSPPEGVGKDQVVTQDDKSLTVDPLGNVARRQVFLLDGQEHRIPTPAGGRGGDITILATAKWDGDHIVIATNINYGNGMKTKSLETWTIDAQGRLVIDSTDTGPGAPPTVKKVVYAKKS